MNLATSITSTRPPLRLWDGLTPEGHLHARARVEWIDHKVVDAEVSK